MTYEVKGEPFPVVICNMGANESVKCQAGAMAWMTPNMEMKTQSGGLGKMFGKALTGEALFENVYTAQGGEGMIAFTTGVPGKILAVSLEGGKTIVEVPDWYSDYEKKLKEASKANEEKEVSERAKSLFSSEE